MAIVIFKHSKNGLVETETVNNDRIIRMSEIEDAYPGYKVRDITFNICDDTHVYLTKEEPKGGR